jgi:hypothetical protein
MRAGILAPETLPVTDPALAALLAAVDAAHAGAARPALAAYARRHGLDPAAPPVTPARDRGVCLSSVLWRRPAGPPGTPGEIDEHQLLVIPETGGTVPEKRHFRLLANPAAPEDPWVVIGDELVTTLAGTLALVGADVRGVLRVTAGTTARTYGCQVDAAAARLTLFQDRHALRADAAWTAVVFQHRYTTLSRLARALGPEHPGVREVRAREVAVPG